MPISLRALILVLAVLFALGCGGEKHGKRYDARGVVREVAPDLAQVVIDHDEIVGLMPAMTMNFDVPDAALLGTLAPGQAIDFVVEFDGEHYRVVEAKVTGEAGSAGSSGTIGGLAAVRDAAPDFELTDQGGEKLALADLRGKLVVLDFIYSSCPGPCPVLTSSHVTLQRMLPPELRARTRFVSISLDPIRDTPMALRQYGESRGADLTGWYFLTGDPEKVAAVVKAFGVGSLRRPDGEIDHLVATFLIDGEGRIAQRFVGLEHEPEALLKALEALAGQAAEG
jgi:protein SCO1/2